MEAEAGLLTLIGAGGCGKTCLAVDVAGRLLDAFPDGVWLVELAALSDPALVDQVVAAVLGVREGVGQSLRDACSVSSGHGACYFFWTTASTWSMGAPA
jgi:predicted ATPase